MDYKLEILKLRENDLSQAAVLLSEAMLDNPLHVAVFGMDVVKRQTNLLIFFKLLLPVVYARGYLYGAVKSGNLIAVLGVMRPDTCNLSIGQKAALICNIFKSFDFSSSLKISYWLFIWYLNDFKQPHWHLGPLAVMTNHRRLGIASQLLNKALELAANQPLWLETDKQQNVDFYTKRGFVIRKELQILNVKNYFMIYKF